MKNPTETRKQILAEIAKLKKLRTRTQNVEKLAEIEQAITKLRRRLRLVDLVIRLLE